MCEALYKELKTAWRRFCQELAGGPFEVELKNQIRKRKCPLPNGQLSEFRFYDLD
jgi:hypothetical protein